MSRSSIFHLNDDILLIICDVLRTRTYHVPDGTLRHHDPTPLEGLAAFSSTCRRLRDLTMPALFRNVKLGRGHWTWDTVRSALEHPPPTQHIQHFTIDIYVHHRNTASPQIDEPLAVELARLLQRLSKLHALSVTVPEHTVPLLQTTFEAENVKLPGVRTLALGAYMNWLVPMCPNLEKLSIAMSGRHDPQDFTDSVSAAPKLSFFEAKAEWSVASLKAVNQAAPKLQGLAIQITTAGLQGAEGFLDMVPVIGAWPDLRFLVVPSIAELRIPGHKPGPRCGNAYWGPQGQALKARLLENRQQVCQSTAMVVFAACSRLEEFWITDWLKYTVTRATDGSVAAVHGSQERRLKPMEAVG